MADLIRRPERSPPRATRMITAETVRMRQRFFFAALFAMAAVFAHADEITTARLAVIARVWGAVKYTHPYLGYRTDIDWDLAAVGAAADAQTTRPLPDVIAAMLSRLGDEMTRVVPDCTEKTITVSPQPPYTVLDDGIVLLPFSTLSAVPLPPDVESAVRTARVIVFDLRLPAGACTAPDPAAMAPLAQILFNGSSSTPSVRKLRHSGYRSQYGTYSGYTSKFIFDAISVTGSTQANTSANAIFIVDDRSTLPSLAIALLYGGRASILSVGPFVEEFPGGSIEIPIGDGMHAVIRAGELARDQNAEWAVRASAILPATASEDSVRSTVWLMTHTFKRRAVIGNPSVPTKSLPPYVWRPEATYATMHYPSFEYRALAAFRFWNVIHYFYAYLPLIGDWDARLPQIIDEVTSAQSQSGYDLALAHVMTNVPDGHSQMYSPTWLSLRGIYRPAFSLMPVEGKPVVVEIIAGNATGSVQTGDELLAIDGKSVADRRAQLEPYTTAANDAAREYVITMTLPWAATESDATYTFRRPDGTTYDATLHRGNYAAVAPAKVWKVLPGNIGYVDLRWLEAGDVDSMISDVMSTRGLIIDIRGYPRGVFPYLGPRLNTSGQYAVAQFGTPTLTGGIWTMVQFTQSLSRSPLPVYQGRTVTLIDERAISQSEHTCLVLEALNKTTFVGSTTAGSNGDVTYGVLPGQIYFLFTGHDVRHLDGRQLQRIGILPDVEVPRTIGAFARADDEVLDRAIAMLSR